MNRDEETIRAIRKHLEAIIEIVPRLAGWRTQGLTKGVSRALVWCIQSEVELKAHCG